MHAIHRAILHVIHKVYSAGSFNCVQTSVSISFNSIVFKPDIPAWIECNSSLTRPALHRSSSFWFCLLVVQVQIARHTLTVKHSAGPDCLEISRNTHATRLSSCTGFNTSRFDESNAKMCLAISLRPKTLQQYHLWLIRNEQSSYETL